MEPHILVVSPSGNSADSLVSYLQKQEWTAHEVSSSEVLKNGSFEEGGALVLFYEETPIKVRQILDRFKNRRADVSAICLTRLRELDEIVGLMKYGVSDCLQIPCPDEKLKLAIHNALKTGDLKRRVMVLESQVGWDGRFGNIVGSSPQMKDVFQMIMTVAKSNATVLVMGESGTGKELVARAVHDHSQRQSAKFIDINCGAIPAELLENELFGHEKGSYTGADRQYIGSFERAQGGTIFMDEVSEMKPALQVKLLRVLQERTIQRVGSGEKVDVDIRVIAATNRDLMAEVEKGNFREDLYYRLNVVPIHLPPLRDRREDIPQIAAFFLEKYSRENEKKFRTFADDTMEAMIHYDWPGNVRELQNNIERIVVLHDDVKVKKQYLPRFIVNYENRGNVEVPSMEMEYQQIIPLRLVEQYAIQSAMARCRGDVQMAAKKLGIGQATLYRKIKKYKIRTHTSS